jgi:hypothetical protein
MIENTKKLDVYNINKNFLSNYHTENITDTTEKGVTSEKSMILGTHTDDKGLTYILPEYSKEDGEIENPMKRFRPLIIKGIIKGYNSVEEAEKDRRLIRNEILGLKQE